MQVELNAFQKLNDDVEFTHEFGINKFIAYNWLAGRRQPFDVNHINTAVVILEINSQGEIIDEIITEDSNAEGFSDGLRVAVRKTKGYWKTKLESSETVFVIIPLIQRKGPADIEREYSDHYENLYTKKFQKLQNLNIQDFQMCENNLCILIDPVRNVYYDPIED